MRRLFSYLLNGILVLFPFTILYVTGVLGIDFGLHWDEDKLIALVEQTIKNGIFLPHWYKYPSISFWLSFGALLPHIQGAVALVGLEIHALYAHLHQVIQTQAFLLQTRQVFLLVSSLSVLWVFGAVLSFKRSRWEALCAACLLGLSWEVAYHARWIAPDAVMMQFAALMILFLALAWRGSRLWLLAAAIAGGLACGTKYPAGLLLLPLLLTAYRVQPSSRWAKKLGLTLVQTIPIFLAAYLISTPGTILEPLTFYKDIAYEMRHYQGAYDSQYVSSGLPHLGLMGVYFSLALFSHYTLPALFFFLCALVGIYAWVRESLAASLTFLSFPLIYILYFSMQQVMVVRNLLVLVPFFAVFGARGIVAIGKSIQRNGLRNGWYAAIFLLFAINATWLFTAAQSITNRNSIVFIDALKRHLQSQPNQSFLLSKRVWKDIKADSLSQKFSLLTGKEDFCAEHEQWVVIYAFEAFGQESLLPLLVHWRKGDWLEFIPTLQTVFFAPWEVNFNYYPLWAGNDRILTLRNSRVCSLLNTK